jgi:DNA-binding HxlR family transcriptional regulator
VPDPAVVSSALDRATEQVGDRWTLRILAALLDGPARYGELEAAVAPISPTVLSGRLKQLEADGLVLATPYQDRPARYAYELTARGRELRDVLALLAQWGGGGGAGASNRDNKTVRHEACGTPVEAVLWCPTCERVADGEADDLHHL